MADIKITLEQIETSHAGLSRGWRSATVSFSGAHSRAGDFVIPVRFDYPPEAEDQLVPMAKDLLHQISLDLAKATEGWAAKKT